VETVNFLPSKGVGAFQFCLRREGKSIGEVDRAIIDAGDAQAHQAVFVEFPFSLP
jgi:hypothetical protein